VFRRLLALGAVLVRLFFVTRAAVRPAAPVTAPDGTHLPITISVDDLLFGLWQSALRAPFIPPPGNRALPARRGAELAGPLLLGLPAEMGRSMERRTSPTARAKRCWNASWGCRSACKPSRPESQRRRGRDPLLCPVGCPHGRGPAGTILVDASRGKGVPMGSPLQRPPVRWARGKARPEEGAVVTGLYTVAAYQRHPPRGGGRTAAGSRAPGACGQATCLRARNCTPPWRGGGSHCVGWRSGSPSTRAPTSSSAWPSSDGAEALQQRW